MSDSVTQAAASLGRLLGDRSIVFVGLMGAGKTAVGRKVAQMAGLPFIDSDHEIENVSRMTIPELFEAYGEPEFRSLECRVVQRLLEEGPQVVSTGGGAFMNPLTREAVAARGVSVWLKADLDLLMARVSRKQDRPLLKTADPRAVMEKLIEVRYPIYAKADVTVVSRDVSKDDMARAVVKAIAAHLAMSSDGVETQ
ncbi:MAG: shikimate kinase [Notoacmeibacter sp.]|nr:shikimate kinase [Notoacmeibacter sp.]MCC0031532.1 shikimate kinase [Brucellaceae bacterium]